MPGLKIARRDSGEDIVKLVNREVDLNEIRPVRIDCRTRRANIAGIGTIRMIFLNKC